MVTAIWSANLNDPADIAAVAADVRAATEGNTAAVHAEYLRVLAQQPVQDDDETATASVLAFGALESVQQAVPEFRRNALAMLGRTEEAEAEARRAYATEQNRRWFRANPTGADAIAAATEAADAARECTAQYLLVTRLEQLREQASAWTEAAGHAPWTDRLPDLAAPAPRWRRRCWRIQS